MSMVLSALDTYAATLFIVVSLSIFGRKLYLRIRYLFLAKGQERRWDHVPTRLKNFIVYGIFQRKVAREWYAGVLHSFIFWAFVILGASVVEITAQAFAPGWRIPTPTIAGFSLNGPLYLAQDVIAVLGAIGVGMALYRRYVIRPKKHMHIIFAIVNTFFMDLTPKGALKKVDLESSTTFGVNRVEQLSWRQLLDGYACTECGRCTAACPANATGKPLDPMRIITNMRDTLDEQGPAIVAGKTEGLPDMFATVHPEDGIWACTTCYACVYECPVMNEHVPKIIEMRRHMVLTQGKMPPEAMETMRKIEQNYNPWGIGWDRRGDWAEGLWIPKLSEGGRYRYLVWVGCVGSFDDRIRRVTLRS